MTDSSCAATSGRWVSPYDGGVWTAASDIDIDHMVPLANAWRVSLFCCWEAGEGQGCSVECEFADL